MKAKERIRERIGDRLKRLRLRCGLSTGEVAERLGVSPSTYREWEYGRAIRGEPYETLAAILGVSLQELLIGERFVGTEALRIIDGIEDEVERLKNELLKQA